MRTNRIRTEWLFFAGYGVIGGSLIVGSPYFVRPSLAVVDRGYRGDRGVNGDVNLPIRVTLMSQ